MRTQLLTAITALAIAIVPVGWHLGYHFPSAYVLFWFFSVSLAWVSAGLTERFFPWNGWPDALIRIGMIGFGAIVLCGLLLGGLGAITRFGYASASAVLAVPAVWRRARWRISTPPIGALPVAVFAIAAALLAFMVGFAATHAPLTLYDAVSYHLFFPARWLQDGHLAIIPTPFSDEAQAYAPGNGELFLLWLMVPFHGDLLARMGQFPFAMLGAVLLFALARRLGARREHAAWPALFWLLSRPTLEQAIGANVDVICATMLLAGLYFGLVAVERDEPRDWLMWGASLGLFWGTKYVSLVYSPIWLLFLFVRARDAGRLKPAPPHLRVVARRLLWSLPGIAAFVLPWYLRNWIAAGSPIYPATLRIAGVTIAEGAFDRAAMLNTIFHTNDLRLFPVIAAKAFGPTLALLWLPAALAGGMALVRRGRWPHACMAVLPVAMALLDWFGFPVNIDARFLMPAIGPALVSFAFVFGSSRLWNRGVAAAYGIGALWILIGVRAEIPASVPWFMGGWLALDGLVVRQFLPWFGVLAALFAALWWTGRQRLRLHLAGAAVWMAASAILAVGGDRWCRPARCEYLHATSPFIREHLLASWRWVGQQIRGSTIAYTGINLPYPLTGERLANRVIYANLDGRDRWRFHDYDRAYRRGQIVPKPPLLATSSRELPPVPARIGPRHDAVRPRYERMQGTKHAWELGLRRSGVGHLFVSALSAYEVDNVWHNAAGFPIEDEWAREHPEVFHLVYENPQVRIYEVTFAGSRG